MDIAITRGIHFEIQYAPILTCYLITSSSHQLIFISSKYEEESDLFHHCSISLSEGKEHDHFQVSTSTSTLEASNSGSESSSYIRSPIDVAHLAQLLGIPIHKVVFNCALLMIVCMSRVGKLSQIIVLKSSNTQLQENHDIFLLRF